MKIASVLVVAFAFAGISAAQAQSSVSFKNGVPAMSILGDFGAESLPLDTLISTSQHNEETDLAEELGETMRHRDIRWGMAVFSGNFSDLVLPQVNPGSVPLFGQSQRPWATDQLGFGRTTISSHGCVVTSLAMTRSFFSGSTVNPRDMNVWMKNNGAFQGDLAVISRVRGWKSRLNYSSVPANLTAINSLIDQGYLLVAQTMMPPQRTGTHFVLITSRQGNTYQINDPLGQGRRTTFQAIYGDPKRWIYTVDVFGRG